MDKTIVAIDPGASGAIAIFAKGRALVANMPKSVQEIQSYLNYLIETYGELIVFIEKVQAYRGKEDDDPGKKFGINKMLKNYTELTTVIQLCGLPYVEVYPVSWQSTLNLSFRKMKLTKSQRKNRYKEYAGNCFPEVPKITLTNGDALCILQFGLHKCGSDQLWIDDHIQNVPKNDLLS